MNPEKWKLYESCFIKSIRRGKIDDAVYWGMVLYRLGRAEGVWRRMFIHVSEDIGLAEIALPAILESLRNNYLTLQKISCIYSCAYEMDDSCRLPFIHAIMLMANAKKSRAVNNALIVHSVNIFPDGTPYPLEERPVPDYAIDHHSPAGRRIGRDIYHFIAEAGKIENEGEFDDEWKHKAEEILRKTNIIRETK